MTRAPISVQKALPLVALVFLLGGCCCPNIRRTHLNSQVEDTLSKFQRIDTSLHDRLASLEGYALIPASSPCPPNPALGIFFEKGQRLASCELHASRACDIDASTSYLILFDSKKVIEQLHGGKCILPKDIEATPISAQSARRLNFAGGVTVLVFGPGDLMRETRLEGSELTIESLKGH